jgi:hypothetical protein
MLPVLTAPVSLYPIEHPNAPLPVPLRPEGSLIQELLLLVATHEQLLAEAVTVMFPVSTERLK